MLERGSDSLCSGGIQQTGGVVREPHRQDSSVWAKCRGAHPIEAFTLDWVTEGLPRGYVPKRSPFAVSDQENPAVWTESHCYRIFMRERRADLQLRTQPLSTPGVLPGADEDGGGG